MPCEQPSEKSVQGVKLNNKDIAKIKVSTTFC